MEVPEEHACEKAEPRHHTKRLVSQTHTQMYSHSMYITPCVMLFLECHMVKRPIDNI